MRKFVGLFALSITLVAAPHKPKTQIVKTLAGDPRTEPRTIQYRPGAAERIYVQHGWETIIVLPKDKQYRDILCGDVVPKKSEGSAAHWIINAFPDSNFVSVRPGSNTLKSTDLTITADHGLPFTFVLTDITTEDGAHADTTVVVSDGENPYREDGKPKFAPVELVDSLAVAVDTLRQKIEAQDDRIAKGLEENLHEAVFADASVPRHGYKYNHRKAQEEPFGVQSIWNNGKDTFIKVSTSEAPAFYEFKDGKLNLVNWDLRDGVYFVPHVVDKCELRIGKKKVTFSRERS